MRAVKTLTAIALVLAVAACGSKTPPPTTTTGGGSETGSAEPVPTEPDPVAAGSGSAEMPPEVKPTEPPPPPPPPELDAFMKLSKEEKTKIMKTKVLPWAQKAFKAYNAKEFAKVTCKTCHGKGADGDYKMPSEELPKLDFEAMKAGKLSKEDMKMAEWMGKVVKPEVAKLIGVPEYSDSNPTGFGCLGCHTMGKHEEGHH